MERVLLLKFEFWVIRILPSGSLPRYFVQCVPSWCPIYLGANEFLSNRLDYSSCVRGVAFESESDLREKGAYKTPDMLLQVPVAVKGPNDEVLAIFTPTYTL